MCWRRRWRWRIWWRGARTSDGRHAPLAVTVAVGVRVGALVGDCVAATVGVLVLTGTSIVAICVLAFNIQKLVVIAATSILGAGLIVATFRCSLAGLQHRPCRTRSASRYRLHPGGRLGSSSWRSMAALSSTCRHADSGSTSTTDP